MRLALALAACVVPLDPGDPQPTTPLPSEPVPVPDPAPPQPTGPEPEPEVYDCEPITGDGPTFYEDNPTYPDPAELTFEVATPAEAAMDAGLLEQATAALDGMPFVTSFLVIRGDRLVTEAYFHGSDANASNNVHSASKSILSTAIGIAEGEGWLTRDDPVADHLPARYAGLVAPELAVRDLLTMTAGLSWREDRTEYQVDDTDDWVAAILDREVLFPPGERFLYSTGDTHVLSAVLTEATGESTCSYVHRKLFVPLGIAAEHWARDPQGYYSGGYNVYLTPRELARFGLLALHLGSWEGAEIVPSGWLAEATSRQIGTGGGYGYGYGWWTHDIDGHPTAIAWGYGGQLAYVIPDVDLVVVVTTNTRDFAVDFDAEPIVRQYVLPAVLR